MGNRVVKNAASKEGDVKIGKYKVTLTKVLGSGSYGTVHPAVNRNTKEKVAVKKMIFAFGTDTNEGIRQLAEFEAETMMIIRHPNILSLLDYETAYGCAWLFMPLCELGDMNRYLSNNADMSLGKRLILMLQMAEAVACLHGNYPPIIHRDIKPGNVLIKRINGEDCAMLTDFGFAKLYDYNMSIAGSMVYREYHESLKGTESFMAPEFFMEDPTEIKYTATVDVFSFGLVNSIILEYLFIYLLLFSYNALLWKYESATKCNDIKSITA